MVVHDIFVILCLVTSKRVVHAGSNGPKKSTRGTLTLLVGDTEGH